MLRLNGLLWTFERPCARCAIFVLGHVLVSRTVLEMGPQTEYTGLEHVRVWYAPEQSQADRPVWEVEDRVGMLRGGSASGSTCRLAPRAHGH